MIKKQVVCALLLTRDTQILLQQKTDDYPGGSGVIMLFGGAVEDGETPGQALKRELFEELELVINDDRLKQLFTDEQPGKIVSAYVVENVEKEKLILHEGERIIEANPQEILEHPKLNHYAHRAVCRVL